MNSRSRDVSHRPGPLDTSPQHSSPQHSSPQHSNLQHSNLQHSNLQHSSPQHSNLQHSNLQHSNLRRRSLARCLSYRPAHSAASTRTLPPASTTQGSSTCRPRSNVRAKQTAEITQWLMFQTGWVSQCGRSLETLGTGAIRDQLSHPGQPATASNTPHSFPPPTSTACRSWLRVTQVASLLRER
jgi:hypothetical protein